MKIVISLLMACVLSLTACTSQVSVSQVNSVTQQESVEQSQSKPYYPSKAFTSSTKINETLEKDDLSYASFYIQKTDENGKVIETRIIKSENTVQETIKVMIRTIYSKPQEYENYYMRSVDEALKWIVEEGDVSEGYVIPEGLLPYKEHIYIFFEDGSWQAETVGNLNRLTIDQIINRISFPNENINESSDENQTSNKIDTGCSLEEFMQMYDDEFDSDEEAEDFYYDWGCESPY